MTRWVGALHYRLVVSALYALYFAFKNATLASNFKAADLPITQHSLHRADGYAQDCRCLLKRVRFLFAH
jgi:hypothetical protein